MWHAEVQAHLKPTKSAKHRKRKKINLTAAKLAPTELDEDVHTLSFDMDTIRAIASIRFGDAITHQDTSDEEIRLWINTLGSDSITPEEQALGRLTRRKLKSLSLIHI